MKKLLASHEIKYIEQNLNPVNPIRKKLGNWSVVCIGGAVEVSEFVFGQSEFLFDKNCATGWTF